MLASCRPLQTVAHVRVCVWALARVCVCVHARTRVCVVWAHSVLREAQTDCSQAPDVSVQCVCSSRIRTPQYLCVGHPAGRLPLKGAFALGMGLLERLLVACGSNQAEGENWAGVFT